MPCKKIWPELILLLLFYYYSISKITVQESAQVHAPADIVYSIIADYTVGHQDIVPKKYFRNFQIEKGGYGEGTEIRFGMVVMGRKINVHQHVREPQPGKILIEEDVDTDRATEFVVEAKPGTQESTVTITTSWTPKGVMGFFERFTTPPILHKIYREELAILDNYAVQKNNTKKSPIKSAV
jgi:hypothetical protein